MGLDVYFGKLVGQYDEYDNKYGVTVFHLLLASVVRQRYILARLIKHLLPIIKGLQAALLFIR
jgi:hypothetical protein